MSANKDKTVIFSQWKAFFTNKQNIKDLVKDAEQVERLGTIARLFTSLDLVNYNILPVYNEALESFVAKSIIFSKVFGFFLGWEEDLKSVLLKGILS